MPSDLVWLDFFFLLFPPPPNLPPLYFIGNYVTLLMSVYFFRKLQRIEIVLFIDLSVAPQIILGIHSFIHSFV